MIEKCIVCDKDCVEVIETENDPHKGCSWDYKPLVSYVILDVKYVIAWADRLVCLSCWRERKKEVMIELFKRNCIKGWKNGTIETIKRLEKELKEKKKDLNEMLKYERRKDVGIRRIHEKVVIK